MSKCPACGVDLVMAVHVQPSGAQMGERARKRWGKVTMKERKTMGRKLAEARERKRVEAAQPRVAGGRGMLGGHALTCICYQCKPPPKAA